ncbi:MAG: hypothetical protein FJ276_20415, partial [Planctomycetes bacterium]|nr:hypothetical protein [Planctomycetota bacterium]
MLKLLALVALYRGLTAMVVLRAAKARAVLTRIRPQIEAIRKANPNDPTTVNQQLQALYAVHSVEPRHTGIAAALDLVFFIGLWAIGKGAGLFQNDSFLWIDSLAAFSSTLPLFWMLAKFAQESAWHRVFYGTVPLGQLLPTVAVYGLLVCGAAWLVRLPAFMFVYGILFHAGN